MDAGQPAPAIWLRAERAGTGRPARRSRAEITAAALDIADTDGLEAVSMRRVAAALDTGAASLYRYVETRDELLDLMSDAAGAEYALTEPTGDWLADLVAIGEQSRAILRRHPWLAELSVTRPVLGPHGVAVLEHVLTVLAGHPAGLAVKLEAFAMLNGITALFALHELAGPGQQRRNSDYLRHALASGAHPGLAQLLAQEQPPGEADDLDPAGRYAAIMTRILAGLLGPPLPPAKQTAR